MLVYLFRPEFERPILRDIKRSTIRPPRRRPPFVGATASLRLWTGKPYRSPQRTIAEVTIREVEDVLIARSWVAFFDRTIIDPIELDEFARLDGFRDWRALREWFDQTHGPASFRGERIIW